MRTITLRLRCDAAHMDATSRQSASLDFQAVAREDVMTLMSTEQRGMTPLRRAAEAAEEASGLRAEIIHGVLMMSPTPRGKHAGTVNVISKQLFAQLPPHLDAFQVASVSMPDDLDDYATPDLLVCDAGFADSDDWLADPGDVEMVVEVVSMSNSTKETLEMVAWYAGAGVPAYLLVDPRKGSWTLYTVPREGEFQGTRHGTYGESVEVTTVSGLTLKIATTDFDRYA